MFVSLYDLELTNAIQLNNIKTSFNQASGDKQVSLADLIVLGGNAAIEKAAGVSVPFTVGRKTQILIALITSTHRVTAFVINSSGYALARTEELLVDKAQQLMLTAPEMTVLVGGMRVLGANYDGSSNGVLTATAGKLTNDFFTNILDINTVWTFDPINELYTGNDRTTGKSKWTATRADLVFGSHAELRAISEVYAESGGNEQMVTDFVKAWVKVMDLDRFDVKK